MRRGRLGRLLYILACLLIVGGLYYALRTYAPPEMWDALRSTYLQQEPEAEH